MGFINDIGGALKDMRITTESNSNSEIKKAEYQRDASNYRERQGTIQSIIWSIFFMIVFLVCAIIFVFKNR